MFVGLGTPGARSDAVDLLLECHQRIRAFLGLALRLGDARAVGPGEVAEAAARVHRYFALALPLHAQDEDESIAPRLRGRDRAVDDELETMAREHREHQRSLGILVESCAHLSGDPGRHGELAGALHGAADDLARQFPAHLAREEQVIFPAVRRFLDGAADAAVVKEIRQRRLGVAG